MAEESSEVKFWCGGSLRLMEAPERHAEFTRTFGSPSHAHVCGEAMPDHPQRHWQNSIWILESALPEERELHEHLRWVVSRARPHLRYLRELVASGVRVDVYLWYSCNEDHRGFGFDPEDLGFFAEAGIRLEVSVMT